jgi:regulatory protein
VPQITRIVQQKKDKERVNIYLDGKYAFPTTLESVLTKSLKVGKELSLQQISDLKNEGDTSKIFNKALNYMTSRPHSERELKMWFRRKKIEDENITEKVTLKLKKLNLINDLEFAKWWVEQRSAFKPKGKNALKAELAQKGINREIIEEVLSDTDRDTEKEMAIKLAEKRISRLQSLEPKEQKRKLLEFLGRRGFSYDIARDAIDELVKKG